MARATVTKTVRLPEPLAKRLEEAAKASDKSENTLIIEAITEHLQR